MAGPVEPAERPPELDPELGVKAEQVSGATAADDLQATEFDPVVWGAEPVHDIEPREELAAWLQEAGAHLLERNVVILEGPSRPILEACGDVLAGRAVAEGARAHRISSVAVGTAPKVASSRLTWSVLVAPSAHPGRELYVIDATQSTSAFFSNSLPRTVADIASESSKLRRHDRFVVVLLKEKRSRRTAHPTARELDEELTRLARAMQRAPAELPRADIESHVQAWFDQREYPLLLGMLPEGRRLQDDFGGQPLKNVHTFVDVLLKHGPLVVGLEDDALPGTFTGAPSNFWELAIRERSPSRFDEIEGLWKRCRETQPGLRRRSARALRMLADVLADPRVSPGDDIRLRLPLVDLYVVLFGTASLDTIRDLPEQDLVDRIVEGLASSAWDGAPDDAHLRAAELVASLLPGKGEPPAVAHHVKRVALFVIAFLPDLPRQSFLDLVDRLLPEALPSPVADAEPLRPRDLWKLDSDAYYRDFGLKASFHDVGWGRPQIATAVRKALRDDQPGLLYQLLAKLREPSLLLSLSDVSFERVLSLLIDDGLDTADLTRDWLVQLIGALSDGHDQKNRVIAAFQQVYRNADRRGLVEQQLSALVDSREPDHQRVALWIADGLQGAESFEMGAWLTRLLEVADEEVREEVVFYMAREVWFGRQPFETDTVTGWLPTDDQPRRSSLAEERLAGVGCRLCTRLIVDSAFGNLSRDPRDWPGPYPLFDWLDEPVAAAGLLQWVSHPAIALRCRPDLPTLLTLQTRLMFGRFGRDDLVVWLNTWFRHLGDATAGFEAERRAAGSDEARSFAFTVDLLPAVAVAMWASHQAARDPDADHTGWRRSLVGAMRETLGDDKRLRRLRRHWAADVEVLDEMIHRRDVAGILTRDERDWLKTRRRLLLDLSRQTNQILAS